MAVDRCWIASRLTISSSRRSSRSTIPVASVAIGGAGAKNAGHLAARILALADAALAERVEAWRQEQAAGAELRIDPRSGQ